MLDMLTRDELSALHSTLCHQYSRQHKIIMGLMDLNQAVGESIDKLLASPMFLVLQASHREVDELAADVYAEIGRRHAEQATYA